MLEKENLKGAVSLNKYDKEISEKTQKYVDKNVEFTSKESEIIQQGIIHKSRLYWTALVSAAAIILLLSLSFLDIPLSGPAAKEQAVQGSVNEGEVLSLDLSDIPEMNIGAEMPSILYADDNIAVIQGTFGVIVYNMQNSFVTNRISYGHMKSYDISMMVASVSQDGTTIYIGNEDMSMTNESNFTHQYDIRSMKIIKITQQPSGLYRPVTIETPGYNEQYDKYFNLEYLTGDKIAELEHSFLYLRSSDWNMQNLQIVRCHYEDGDSKVFDIFK